MPQSVHIHVHQPSVSTFMTIFDIEGHHQCARLRNAMFRSVRLVQSEPYMRLQLPILGSN
jgi:hypothetical protein